LNQVGKEAPTIPLCINLLQLWSGNPKQIKTWADLAKDGGDYS